MAHHDDYDALIVGARCAGASLAMLLARAGLRVLAIDKSAYGADALSTHALMRGGVLQLHRWGALQAVIASGAPPVRTTTFHYGDEAVRIEIAPQGGIDGLYAPRRTTLDRVLVDQARAAGAEIEFGARLVDLTRSPTGRVVGATISRGGALRAISAGVVIGADGVKSTVARLVDAPVYHRAANATATTYCHVRGLEVDGYHWYYRRGIGAGAIPTNGGHCVFVGDNSSSRGGHTAGTFDRLLAEVAPQLADRVAAAEHAEPLRRFGGVRGFMRQSHGPGWALVGDAGYFKDPITAHGITDALRDAELCARAVVRGHDDALADYQVTRDRVSHDLFEITDSIASMTWTLDELKQLHRALSASMRPSVDALLALDAREAAAA